MKKDILNLAAYTGNGNADGTFVYTGFKPAFIIIKSTQALGINAQNWHFMITKRLGYNVDNNMLRPNISNAEQKAR